MKKVSKNTQKVVDIQKLYSGVNVDCHLRKYAYFDGG